MGDRVFPQVSLSTERLLLRPFEPGDAESVHATWNDEDYLRFAPVGLPTAEAGLDQARQWCTTGADDRRKAGIGVGFAVARSDERQLVGHVALINTDWIMMVTEIHYWTAPWGRGKGYAAEAVRAVARWALIAQGFARVALLATTDNVASRRVAESAGFRFEGTLRNAALTRAGRGDFAVYGLVPQDVAEQ
jgi:ribosomal-protein-alanine N-acetyltransferase